MKVETIVNLYSRKNKLEEPLIIKVLDSVKDFGRKLTLRISFKEVKETFEEYEKESKKMVKKILSDYVKEENKKNADKEGWEDLDADKIERVPPQCMPIYNKGIEEKLNADVQLKTPLKLTLFEIKQSGISISEMNILEEFIDFDSSEDPPKKTKPKKEIKK